MRTIAGVISASIAMASSEPLVVISFCLLTFYLIYLEFNSDKKLPK
jgi:hypothetical protein